MEHNGEKTPLQSKKFVAYLVSSILWKAIVLTALFVFREQLKEATMAGWWFMVSTVIVAGFVDTVYIGGQAAVDTFVRVAQAIMTGRPQVQPQAPVEPPQPKKPDPQTPKVGATPPAEREVEDPPAGPNQPDPEGDQP